jgi:putative ABC transport system ATP-binding protein
LGILATLDRPSIGELWVCEKAVHTLTEEQRAEVRLQNIGFVFQFSTFTTAKCIRKCDVTVTLAADFDFKQAEKKHWHG